MKYKIFAHSSTVTVLALILIIGAVAPFMIGDVLAHGNVDQSNPVGAGGSQILANGPVAQEFTPSQPILVAVDVNLSLAIDEGSDTLTVNIREGSLASPVLATTSQLVAPCPNIPPFACGLTHFDFPSPLMVTPGNTYILELQATKTTHAWVRADGGYSRGAAIIQGIVEPAFDFSFQTYSQPTPIDSTFKQQQKLGASDVAPLAGFGGAVAISVDTAVVGAQFHDGAAGIDQGTAYVFVRSGGGAWTQQQKLEPSFAAEDSRFGASVAISGDTIVVGAPGDPGELGLQQGSAYVFVRSGGVWSEQRKLEASDPAQFDGFGNSVVISDDTIVVGAVLASGAQDVDQGAAYVFLRSSGGVWTQTQKLEVSVPDARFASFFGDSMAISGDTLVIGAPNYFDGAASFGQGAAYVFVRSGGIWSEQQILLASDPGPFELFGDSVAISGDTVVVGASFGTGAVDPQQGTAYVFVFGGDQRRYCRGRRVFSRRRSGPSARRGLCLYA